MLRTSRQRGQTLAMALIILGILLVLGTVFIALVARSIRTTGRNQQRSLAFDLAEAGVRYVHAQMLNSLDGADWRPVQAVTIDPASQNVPLTDPDYDFLRLPNTADPTDQGGPDKLGSYTRLLFERGRALVRVRYAPSDPRVFSVLPIGELLQPGLLRNYTMVESVGKAGKIIPNDPTTLRENRVSGRVRETAESKKVVGFISCGLIEHAMFITNKNHVSRPAEIGAPDESGQMYGDNGAAPALVNVPVVFGAQGALPNPDNGGPRTFANGIPYGGGMYVNADLMIYGNVVANMNSLLGDSLLVAGSIRGADDNATLTLNQARANGNTWQTSQTNNTNNTPDSINSDNPRFSTQRNFIRDSYSEGDSQGFPRGTGIKDAPSILRVDPDTGNNRNLQLTQSSGRIYTRGNSGKFGHGQGPYIDNASDRQMRVDEQGREDVGSAESLVYDWLNPNNGQKDTGWKGAFYAPKGAYMRLLTDGFIIIRNGATSGNEWSWRRPDGTLVNNRSIRYKLVPDANGQVWIFNSYSVDGTGNPIDITQVTPATVNSYKPSGYPFNGVVYFAGNVRVRGEIPTDMQLTVVSNATIYIEGSITKGVINNGMRAGTVGTRITTLSKSMLALLAKDYVAVNTTQFFGPAPLQNLEEAKEAPSAVEWNPLLVRVDGGIDFNNEFLLDPNTPASLGGDPTRPSTWHPFATQYTTPGGSSTFIPTQLLLTQTMADGPAPASFINMDVNYPLLNTLPGGGGEWQYLFDLNSSNAATPFLPPGYTPVGGYTKTDKYTLYGLGAQPWQRYSKFEATSFPIVPSDFTFDTNAMRIDGSLNSDVGAYHLLVEGLNDFNVVTGKNPVGGTPTNDYMVARAAIVPQDIRIEAVLFAEEGSFFVIPGPWFNPNPNDRRDAYDADSSANGQVRADQDRLDSYGASPQMPFYGEPLDVRVQIFGSVVQNMPVPISQQAEWIRKWGWIPRYHGASGQLIPAQHVPAGKDVTTDMYVPNISITYDPSLATDRNVGFTTLEDPTTWIRSKRYVAGYDTASNPIYSVSLLPPLPRLPVSPTLAYFGEVKP